MYYVDCADKSLNKYGEELCGDKVEIVRNDDGMFLAVLADGLGSGVKANILSTLTSKILCTMLANGLQLEDAIETVTSTLPVCKDRDLAYSTFTIIYVGNDGRMNIAEFDNPKVVFIRDNKIHELKSKTLTIAGKEIILSRTHVQKGDSVIAFSDGITHAGVGRLLDLGWQAENIKNFISDNVSSLKSPRAMVAKMLSAVLTLYEDKPGDDSTVLCVNIKEKTPITLMVGPPSNKELDSVVAKKLVDSKGLKVVCGGTTSQIVSNYLDRELKVSIDYASPSVPPTASIEGIDLVTEGVITLGKALELMKSIDSNDPQMIESYLLKKKDGATLIAKMLLDKGTEVNFLVGKAINPAHQNPDLPVNFGLKLRIIREMAKHLDSIGKKCSIEYF